jgi:hypothetical protein
LQDENVDLLADLQNNLNMVENYFSEFQIPIAKLKKVYIPRQ